MAARRVLRGQCFDLHYLAVAGSARLGLIVPKRLARAASLRNAIKRQGREAFRAVALEIPSCDVVLRLTRPLKGIRASDGNQKAVWRKEFDALLQRLASARP